MSFPKPQKKPVGSAALRSAKKFSATTHRAERDAMLGKKQPPNNARPPPPPPGSSPGQTPGPRRGLRSLKADLSPGSWRHKRQDFDAYELLASYDLTKDADEPAASSLPARALRLLPVAALVWFCGGGLLYAYVNGWGFAQGLYHAVDTGFLLGSHARRPRGLSFS